MAHSKLIKSLNKHKFINRGNRCYGLKLDSLNVIFIRGLPFNTVPQLWKVINKNFSEIINYFISVKYSNNFGDTFFRVKVRLSMKKTKSICREFENLLPGVIASCSKISHFINKKSFKNIKKGLLCGNLSSDTNSNNAPQLYNTPTSSVNYINNHSFTNSDELISLPATSSSATPSAISPFISDSCKQKFSFCLSWNTNGWNFVKRDGIEYFNYLFKPLFLCFQETGNGSKLDDDIFCNVTVRNYRYFRKRANKTPGMRGLYLGYHHTCQASLENNEFSFIISLSTYSLWNHSKCSIGNVYVPQRKLNHERTIAKSEIISWLRCHSNHASILLGDFNCSTEELQDFISPIVGWSVLPILGSNISWFRGDLCSDIDHAIINCPMSERISSAMFVDYFPISDHKPLLVHCNDVCLDDSFSLPKNCVRWDRNQCKIVKESIYNNNQFSILNNEIFSNSNLSTDQMVEKFISTANDIAKELNIISPAAARKNMFEISKSIHHLQKKKLSLYKSIRRKGSLKNIPGFLKNIEKYKRICKSIKKKSNEFRKKEYQHWIEMGCKQAIQHNGKKMWNWIKRNAKTNKNLNYNHPLKDKKNQLVSSTKGQLEIFHKHYKKLASDPKGQSLSSNYWKNSYITKSIISEDHCEWNINQEISKEEIKEAILSTPNYKASGPDNIPIEFYKAMLPDDTSDSSSSSGLDFLHKLFNQIWDGDFPEAWNNASIVSIPKKGDLTDCDNYRGISLINNGIKIISKIVASRISEYGIQNNFIRPEQFGFRNKEECISLYISIRDICQRRKINNEVTYLAFLDLKKAYDSVPIYNILTKLKCLGIRGKSYQFLENLYLTSKACVKKDNQYSDAFKVMKGVRQGCPLSPILFNLFINDIFNDCKELGVEVGNEFCCGGLFADDIVLCAPSRKNLKKLLKCVNKWAINNNMFFGINKCATMVVRPNTPIHQGRRDPTFYLGKDEIPKVKCYTYLGIPFDNTLSLKPIIDSMKNKVMKALFNVRGFLKNPLIPIPFKRTLISSIVISRVAYYAPLLGSNKSRTNSTQQLINKGLYWILGSNGRNSFVSLYNLSKELNIPPLSAKCALAQIRCFEKWKSSNCIISSLVNNIPKHRKYFWSKESRYLSRKLAKFETRNKILEYYWKRDFLKESIKAKKYIKYKFEETRDYNKLNLEYPQYTKGFHWLLKARCGYKLDSAVLKAANLVNSSFPDCCYCCNKDNSEQNLEHWLMHCSSFDEIRSKILDNLDCVLPFFIDSNHDDNDENSGSNSMENCVNENLSVSNSSVNNLSVNELNNNSKKISSKIYNFLLGGRRYKNNRNVNEWKNLCSYQLKSGNLSDIPFLAKTAAFFNSIMPIVSGQRWLKINSHSTTNTKSANADNTVRQARSASVHIREYAHATERNRNS